MSTIRMLGRMAARSLKCSLPVAALIAVSYGAAYPMSAALVAAAPAMEAPSSDNARPMCLSWYTWTGCQGQEP